MESEIARRREIQKGKPKETKTRSGLTPIQRQRASAATAETIGSSSSSSSSSRRRRMRKRGERENPYLDTLGRGMEVWVLG